MRSVESEIKFLSYKIDDFSFESAKDLNILTFAGALDPKGWRFEFSFGAPSFFKKRSLYVVNLKTNISYIVKTGEVEKSILNIKCSLSGAFESSNGQISAEVEEKIVKYHLPTILFPYLRGTVSTFVANSGFGSLVFPLVNINKIADDLLKEIPVQIVE